MTHTCLYVQFQGNQTALTFMGTCTYIRRLKISLYKGKKKTRIWTIEGFKFYLFNIFHSILCVDYVNVQTPVSVHMCRSEDNLLDSVLSYHCVFSKMEVRIRLGSKPLAYSVTSPVGPVYLTFIF